LRLEGFVVRSNQIPHPSHEKHESGVMREPRSGVFAPSRAQMLHASRRVKFRRALTLIFFTLLMPGSAQLLMGNRRIGRIAVRVWLGFLAAAAIVGVLALTSRTAVFWLAANGPLLLL